ncbi:hypothetical protein NE237_006787 [Protea cynaroides]|uniref:Uncharacterized protein n=1 Tax=Protea cynaroides TaxID=273540 RepID=A0A9Q0KN27_9MAGN|nr:hypothetical protein NE237_006787 [Protea cynaroides]
MSQGPAGEILSLESPTSLYFLLYIEQPALGLLFTILIRVTERKSFTNPGVNGGMKLMEDGVEMRVAGIWNSVRVNEGIDGGNQRCHGKKMTERWIRGFVWRL